MTSFVVSMGCVALRGSIAMRNKLHGVNTGVLKCKCLLNQDSDQGCCPVETQCKLLNCLLDRSSKQPQLGVVARSFRQLWNGSLVWMNLDLKPLCFHFARLM